MKIKTRVVDFLNMLAEGKIKPNTQINYGGLTYIVDYPNLCGIYEECAEPKRENSLFTKLNICSLNYEVEIIEDKEEPKMFEQEWFNSNEGIMNIVEVDLAVKINELIKAVKQLDKKVNSIEQK